MEVVRLMLSDAERLEERNCCAEVGKSVRGYILDHYAEKEKSQKFFIILRVK